MINFYIDFSIVSRILKAVKSSTFCANSVCTTQLFLAKASEALRIQQRSPCEGALNIFYYPCNDSLLMENDAPDAPASQNKLKWNIHREMPSPRTLTPRPMEGLNERITYFSYILLTLRTETRVHNTFCVHCYTLRAWFVIVRDIIKLLLLRQWSVFRCNFIDFPRVF